MIELTQSKTTFIPDPHGYLNAEGKELIGVTTLMRKYGLSPDYDFVDKDVLQRSAEKGSAIHRALEILDDKKPMVLTPEVKAYLELKKQNNLNVLCSEFLVSDESVVATKIDKVLDDFSLGDIKTTSTLHINALQWQLSIGAYLFERQTGKKVPSLFAVHIHNGEAKYKSIERLPDSYVSLLIFCESAGKDKEYFTDALNKLQGAILTEEDNAVLVNVENDLIRMEQAVKVLKEKREELYAKIMTEMEKMGITKAETDSFIITRVLPTTATSMDTDRIKKEHPEIASEYVKTTTKKGYIKIKLK